MLSVATTPFNVAASGLAWGDPARLLIGLNCLQPFGYGISSSGAYRYSGDGPFANGGTDLQVMPDARLATIRSTGFAFVRMAVDVGALLAAPNDGALDTLNAQILAGVTRRVQAGLRVICDMHVLGNGQHPVRGWSQADLVDGPSGPKLTRLKYVVARLAAALWARCAPAMVCVELYNEPGGEWSYMPTTYNVQIRDYWAAVRAVCGFTLVVGGSNFNALDGTPAGDMASGLTHLVASAFDANTAFAFHPYEPGVFVFQGLPGMIYADMHGLPFPVTDYPGGQAKAEADFSAAATAAGHAANIAPVVTQTSWSTSLSKAWSQYGTPALLAARMGKATQWADQAGVDRRRLFNTEVGVNYATPGAATSASAGAFYRAHRDNAVSARIGCLTVHEMQGSGYGIQSPSAPWTVEPAIVAGLFG